MDKIQIILSLLVVCIGLIISVVTFISKYIKSAKGKRLAENIIDMSNILLSFIGEAEHFVAYSGEEKKAYVMTKANQYAIDNNIKFDCKGISDKVDKIVALTNEVNVNKDKIETANQNVIGGAYEKIIIED